MEDDASPLLLRRRLRNELRAARLETGLTQEQVATAMEWSLSKMNRIEKAKTGISANDLKALLPLYGITAPGRVEDLLALARAARQAGWWRNYAGIAPGTLLELIDYEYAAAAISHFEPMVVPGILQTDEYATAVLRFSYGEGEPAERVAALVNLRVRRQNLLTAEGAPRFSFVLDESVIRRPVGGSAVMRDQIERLVELADRPNVTIQVVPFAAGLHPGTRGSFKVIESGEPGGDVVFVEGLHGDVIMDEPEEVSSYLKTFERIAASALGAADSAVFLRAAAGEMP